MKSVSILKLHEQIEAYYLARVLPNLVRAIYVITVSEDRGKITLALSSYVMMIIMVLCPAVKRNKFCGRLGEVVSVQYRYASKKKNNYRSFKFDINVIARKIGVCA